MLYIAVKMFSAHLTKYFTGLIYFHFLCYDLFLVVINVATYTRNVMLIGCMFILTLKPAY